MWVKKQEWQSTVDELSSTRDELSTTKEELSKSRKDFESMKLSYELNIDAANRDPFIQQIRILLPDEVDGLRETAANQLLSDPNGQHSHCHRVLLLVLRLLYNENHQISSDSIAK